MEILLFIITWPGWATWWARAVIVAVAASAVLNISPFLPWLRDIKASRINARWVGYMGLTLALALWMALNPNEGSQNTFWAWVIIAVVTLFPNTLIHWRRESVGGDGRNNGPLPPIVILSADKCEEILEHLVDPRRNLVVAQAGIQSAILRARQAAERMPDQVSGQIWVQAVRDPLITASERIEEAQGDYTRLHQAVSGLWQTFNEMIEAWRLEPIISAK